MFGFGKKSDDDKAQGTQESGTKPSLFGRLKQGLSKTRSRLSDGLSDLLGASAKIDDALLDELETQLLAADVGLEATDTILAKLRERLRRNKLEDSADLLSALKDEMAQLLAPVDKPLELTPQDGPFVILVVGVNGVGKTTTIGKLSKRFQSQGKSIALAAGDTFRAAAVEQLQVWGERNNIPVVAQATGADSASVIFDAYQSAKAKGIDVLIADTAGRLHNKDNLMSELEKIVRVLRKQDDALPHEILLVLDATTGQNAINQARSFHQAVALSGIALTKLDGTAKGGVVFTLASQFEIPLRFIGIGEQVDDLRPFSAEEFVAALFGDNAEPGNDPTQTASE